MGEGAAFAAPGLEPCFSFLERKNDLVFKRSYHIWAVQDEIEKTQ